MQDFHGTDVDVPCTVTVDGKTCDKNVGVHFRGMSSPYMMVPMGSKRSLNLSFDLADSKQRIGGYKTLNLLNNHDDSTLMSAVLYSHVARQYIPTPKANFVKVVINGEYWGVYTNLQQIDKPFLKENFPSDKGTRWKVRGTPGASGGLEYLGEDLAPYKQRYQMKGAESEKAWKALVNFCKVLNQTPTDKLAAALEPICDVDGLLWFLALDVGLINCDGYWIRQSDYGFYMDEKGKFHFIPADINEGFRPPQGPGMGGMGGRGGRGGPGGQGGPGGGRGGQGGQPGGGRGGQPGGGPPEVGPGGVGGGFPIQLPRPGEVLPATVQDQLQLTEEQKKKLAELQKDVDAKIEKLLTAEQNRQFKDLRDRGPTGGFGGGPMGGFGPGGGLGGPMGGGGGGGGSVNLDPRLSTSTIPEAAPDAGSLAVPKYREQYLKDIRTIADKSLDWKNLGPVLAQFRKLIEKDLEIDTRKLDPYEAFLTTTADDATSARGRDYPIRLFADQRRKYLMDYKDSKK